MGVAKSKKSALPKVLLTIVVILLLLVLVAEFGLRFMIGKQLKDEFQAQASSQGISATEEPSISFGASPLLLGIAREASMKSQSTPPTPYPSLTKTVSPPSVAHQSQLSNSKGLISVTATTQSQTTSP